MSKAGPQLTYCFLSCPWAEGGGEQQWDTQLLNVSTQALLGVAQEKVGHERGGHPGEEHGCRDVRKPNSILNSSSTPWGKGAGLSRGRRAGGQGRMWPARGTHQPPLGHLPPHLQSGCPSPSTTLRLGVLWAKASLEMCTWLGRRKAISSWLSRSSSSLR